MRHNLFAGILVLLLLSGLVHPEMAARQTAPSPVAAYFAGASARTSPLAGAYLAGAPARTPPPEQPVRTPFFSKDLLQNDSSIQRISDLGGPVPHTAEATDTAKPSLIPGDLFLEDGVHVMASDGKQLWAAGSDNRTLLTSVDDGLTWTKRMTMPKTVQTIYITPIGTILVSISNNSYEVTSDEEIYRSTDGGQSFASVLQIRTGHVYHWNIAADNDGYIFVSEYGYKGQPENARRIYRSADNGSTWKVVYQPATTEGYHNHKILIDRQDPRIIYQSVGDGPNSQILKSVDRGDTWHVVSKGYNPTSAVQFDDHILWGLDNTPFPGFISLSKANDAVRTVFTPPAPYAGSVYDIMSADGVLYAGFLSYDWSIQTWNGTIFVSRDKGASWTKWAEWPKLDEQGIGFYHFVRHGKYGYVNVTLPVRKGETVVPYRGTVRFPLLKPVPQAGRPPFADTPAGPARS